MNLVKNKNGYTISRLRMQNYKVFEDKELDFNNSKLIVLDGPNGFGKTSVFDAIELLITGDLSRISSSSNITKNETFESVFIMKDIKKDLIIKAEFVDQENDKKFVLVKRIVGKKKAKKSKNNNPTKLADLIKTYIIDDYDVNDYNNLEEVEHNKIFEKIDKSIYENYGLFYYIKQEDRLNFLNKNEKERMELINSLFNINDDKAYAEKLDKALRYCNSKNKKIADEKEKIITEMSMIKSELNDKEYSPQQYKRLFTWQDRIEYWDEEKVEFSEISKLNDAVEVIGGLQRFVNNYGMYKAYLNNQWIHSIISNTNDLIVFVILLNYDKNYDELYEKYKEYKKVHEIGNYATSLTYENIEFKTIAQIFEIEIDLTRITEIKERIVTCNKNMGSISALAQKLNRARKSFYSEENIKLNKEGKFFKDSQCMLCGCDWGDAQTLENQIEETTAGLLEFKDENATIREKQLEKLKLIYEEVKEKIDEYLSDNGLFNDEHFDYMFDKKNKVNDKFQKFIAEAKLMNIETADMIIDLEDEINEEKLLKLIISQLEGYIEDIPDNFVELQANYNFDRIWNYYFKSSEQNVSQITHEDLENKIKYIQYAYYDSSVKKRNELSERKKVLDEYTDELEKTVIPNIEKVKNSYLSAIGIYQNEMIKSIEIPFYLYAGRLLQNYQGGIGVFIKEEQSEDEEITRLDKIKFVSPNRQDHDILYTLSSGQLSAVIIALTLALNKVYAHNSLPCILIDDPVQTMDDINIASFVELLRNEFPDKQVIISTHEDGFSRYVRYKYNKYNYKAKAITLKDDIPEIVV